MKRAPLEMKLKLLNRAVAPVASYRMSRCLDEGGWHPHEPKAAGRLGTSELRQEALWG